MSRPGGKPALENVKPPYYGTIDTKANRPENLARVADTNENWSVGDFLAWITTATIYMMRLILPVRHTGSCRLSVKAATSASPGQRRRKKGCSAGLRQRGDELFQPGNTITIPSTGIITTNYLHVGGATNARSFIESAINPRGDY